MSMRMAGCALLQGAKELSPEDSQHATVGNECLVTDLEGQVGALARLQETIEMMRRTHKISSCGLKVTHHCTVEVIHR